MYLILLNFPFKLFKIRIQELFEYILVRDVVVFFEEGIQLLVLVGVYFFHDLVFERYLHVPLVFLLAFLLLLGREEFFAFVLVEGVRLGII